jgi:hypothetical protein
MSCSRKNQGCEKNSPKFTVAGYSDQMAWELGLIDFEGSFEDARRHFCVKGKTLPWTTGPAWLRQILMKRTVMLVRTLVCRVLIVKREGPGSWLTD